jgi:predicted dinucleotide-binding enzyme
MSYAIIGAGKAGQALARAFTRKGLVKTFNHLSAATLAQDPDVKGGRRVLFLSTDDERAAARVAKLVEELGFAPVKLGKLTEGGLLMQGQGRSRAQLIFQNFVKFNLSNPLFKGDHHAHA